MAVEDNTREKERMREQKQQRGWNCSANVKKNTADRRRPPFPKAVSSVVNWESRAGRIVPQLTPN